MSWRVFVNLLFVALLLTVDPSIAEPTKPQHEVTTGYAPHERVRDEKPGRLFRVDLDIALNGHIYQPKIDLVMGKQGSLSISDEETQQGIELRAKIAPDFFVFDGKEIAKLELAVIEDQPGFRELAAEPILFIATNGELAEIMIERKTGQIDIGARVSELTVGDHVSPEMKNLQACPDAGLKNQQNLQSDEMSALTMAVSSNCCVGNCGNGQKMRCCGAVGCCACGTCCNPR